MILAIDSQCFWFFFSLLAYLKDEVSHPSNPSLFDERISALSAALAAQTSVTASMSEYATTKRHESDPFHALSLYLITLTGILGSTGYRFPPFNQSLL